METPRRVSSKTPSKSTPTNPKSLPSLEKTSTISSQPQFIVQNAHTSPFTTHLKSCRCWMHPDSINDLKFEPGQHIVVSGMNKVVCVVWPSDNVQLGDVHLCGALRDVIDVVCEDVVRVESLDGVEVCAAVSVEVECKEQEMDKEFKEFVIDAIYDLVYVVREHLFEIVFKGVKKIVKLVVQNEGDVFRIDPNTTFKFTNSEPVIKNGITFASIGGLEKEIELIKELYHVPLFNNSQIEKFGLKPPRGILLYGPSGCGKTMICRAIQTESTINFITINIHDILSTFYGESEQKLRDIFDEAKENAPSIVFIDDIDGLCPKRDDGAGIDRRIVTTLLTLMDGADDNQDNRFIVLATTSNPDALDAAFRRPGRFDHEIEIGIPVPAQRLDILRCLLRDTRCEVSVGELEGMAGRMHGYVGADIANVVRESAVSLLREIHQSTIINTDGELSLESRHLLDGMSRVRPSAMREICLEVPTVQWSDIGGQEEIKQRLQEAVEWPIRNPLAFSRFGINPPKGILLYGPPGCSKTLIAKALATSSACNFFAIKGPALFNKHVGESEKAVRDIFRKARAAAPAIIFFDEIDSVASKRKGGGDGVTVGDRVISQLLTEMDGIVGLRGVTVLAATNRPDVIDSALMRPGRLDRVLYVGPPDYAARVKILEIRCGRMCVASDVDFALLARQMDGFSGAEVVSVCQEAGFAAMEENVEIEKISMRHFEVACMKIVPRITKEMLAFYEAFNNRTGLQRV